MAAVLSVAGIVQADVLYNIASFNNNGTRKYSIHWVKGITTIITAPGITGTDDAGLLSLQTINADANTSSKHERERFMNNGSDKDVTTGAIVLDDTSGGYMQFGITGSNIALTSLTFQAVAAAWENKGRGYDIDISINGGDYVDLDATILTNHRKNGGMELFSIDLTGFPRGISSVDFRLSSTGGAVEYIDFKINGTVIQEPTTQGLGLLF